MHALWVLVEQAQSGVALGTQEVAKLARGVIVVRD